MPLSRQTSRIVWPFLGLDLLPVDGDADLPRVPGTIGQIGA